MRLADDRPRRGRPRTDRFWVEWVKSQVVNDPKAAIRSLVHKAMIEAVRQGRNDAPSETTIKRIRADILKAPDEVQRDYRFAYWPESFERGDLPWEAQGALLELLRYAVEHKMAPSPGSAWFVFAAALGARFFMGSGDEHATTASGDPSNALDDALRAKVDEYWGRAEKAFDRALLSEQVPESPEYWRPTVRLARWYWHVRQASPEAPVAWAGSIALYRDYRDSIAEVIQITMPKKTLRMLEAFVVDGPENHWGEDSTTSFWQLLWSGHLIAAQRGFEYFEKLRAMHQLDTTDSAQLASIGDDDTKVGPNGREA